LGGPFHKTSRALRCSFALEPLLQNSQRPKRVRRNDRKKQLRRNLVEVALDRESRATAVEPVVPETGDETRRYRQAGERREARLSLRNRLKAENPAHR
jgi:hypothetical protein